MKKKILVLACAVVSACAVSRVDPLAVSLRYTPDAEHAPESEHLPVVGPLQCGDLSALEVTDARTDKTLGERVHESKPLKADVTTVSDVANWVQTGMASVLAQNGIKMGQGPRLDVGVDAVHTHESIWHRSSYEAKVSLTGKLVGPGGQACWSEAVQGTGGNYGYAGSLENYQQTLNRALVTATLKMMQLQGFKDALCKCR